MVFSCRNIYEFLLKMEEQKDIIIFKGSEKIFCAGGDVKQLSASPELASVFYKFSSKSYYLITNYKKPYVALINGLAMGGAAAFSVPAKYRIATERTVFSMPETAIGYFNDGGSSYFLSRLDNNLGIYMGMTGASVKGYDMKKVGLATHFIESHKLDELEKMLIKCETHEDVERILSDFSCHPSSLVTELDQILPKIKQCFNGSTVEEIYENLQRDGSAWATNTLNTLNRKSPTALKVTHRSMITGKDISLGDCLKMEMRLTFHHANGSDLKEGVRAVLLDKDLKPKWSRKSIYDVTEADVERFFKPIPESYELTFEEIIRNKL